MVGAAVLALVRRTGVGHLHFMAALGQRLVGFTVHLLHGSRGSAQSLSTATAHSTESEGRDGGGDGGDGAGDGAGEKDSGEEDGWASGGK